MKVLIQLIFTILLLLHSIMFFGQHSFVHVRGGPEDEYGEYIFEDGAGNYISTYCKQDLTTKLWTDNLLKLNPYGDSIAAKTLIPFEDTIIVQRSIWNFEDNPVEYLLFENAHIGSNHPSQTFQIFTKLDEDFNIIWKKVFQLRPLSVWGYTIYFPQYLKLDAQENLFAANFNNDQKTLVLFKFSDFGDSLAARTYHGDSAGRYVYDVTYNHDSSGFVLQTSGAYDDVFWAESEMIELDLNLEQIRALPHRRFFDRVSSCLLPDGRLIVSGLFWFPFTNGKQQINLYSFDTLLQVTDSASFTNPDRLINKHTGFKHLDYHYPDAIYSICTFDYEPDLWVGHPSWVAIGKFDQDLNLLTEKYFGGDAYYWFSHMAATKDGGLIFCTTRFDHLTQYKERDAYIVKYDSLELTVGMYEEASRNNPYFGLKRAIIFPNPASEDMIVRTAEYQHAIFDLFNLTGSLVSSQALSALESRIKVRHFPKGIYMWAIRNETGLIEKGKIIIH
ncbi:MAG: T9SS type A sorting domain-containing protein [Bacteroidales bacterium]|nr:T9SS type A sorting domain-containing protein [Bacteroidales bacterium]